VNKARSPRKPVIILASQFRGEVANMSHRSGDENNSNLQHQLVVFAAIGGVEKATWAWSEINKIWTVEKLDDISLRFLPAIYSNIGIGRKDFNQKVAGKYRFNFALNLQRLRVLKSIFASLNNECIDYRVTKGLAISLRVQSLGFRIMGYVDIVVKKRHLRRTLEILSSHGFSDKYLVDCPNSSKSLKNEKYTWVNLEGIELDIHVAESAFPSVVFNKMFSGPAQEVCWEDVTILIPTDDLLFEHAVLHGKQSSSVTDRWQTLVDISVLSRTNSSKYSQQFKSVNETFLDLNKVDPGQQFKILTDASRDVFSSNHFARYYFLNRALSHSFRFSKPQIIHFSKNSAMNCYARASSKFKYLVWTFLNKRLLVELFIVRYLGGFLKVPLRKFVTHQRFNVCDSGESIATASSPVEFRIKIKLTDVITKGDIYLQSESFIRNSFEIFCNGKLLGNSNGLEGFGVTYYGTSSELEISIRNPSHSCLTCIPSFGDLVIWVDSTEILSK
jgi:hypothetical protein